MWWFVCVSVCEVTFYAFPLYLHAHTAACVKRVHFFSDSSFTNADIIAAEAGGVSVSQDLTLAPWPVHCPQNQKHTTPTARLICVVCVCSSVYVPSCSSRSTHRICLMCWHLALSKWMGTRCSKKRHFFLKTDTGKVFLHKPDTHVPTPPPTRDRQPKSRYKTRVLTPTWANMERTSICVNDIQIIMECLLSNIPAVARLDLLLLDHHQCYYFWSHGYFLLVKQSNTRWDHVSVFLSV